VEDFADEPVSPFDNDPKSYGHLLHYNTVDLVSTQNKLMSFFWFPKITTTTTVLEALEDL
jgi:hypothetical protein